MLHLLPQSHIEEVKKEYKQRSLSVVCNMLSFVLFVFILGCVPSLIIAATERGNLAKQSSALTLKISEEDKEAALLFESAVKRGVSVAQGGTSLSSKELDYILSYSRPGILLNSISIRREAGEEQVDLFGIAETRTDLSTFIRVIEADGTYEIDDVPASTFTKDKDLIFTLTLKKHLKQISP